MRLPRSQWTNGFTLIELIAVVVLTAIVATMSTKIITLPVNSYLDTTRRLALLDAADISLRRLQRDVRRALPNSIRISADGKSLEMLHTLDGGRYRLKRDPGKNNTAGLCTPGGSPELDNLDFTTTDNCFEVLGTLRSFDPTAAAGQLLVVYNLGVAPASAYSGLNSSGLLTTSTKDVLRFNAFQFPFASPQQRFFIVDTPVTYRCSGGQLLRFSGYAITAAQVGTPAGVTGQVQVNNVQSCNFVYTAGVATRAAQVEVMIRLTDSAGESIVVVRQIHLDNAA